MTDVKLTSDGRCPHGVRHPHPCRECEDAPLPSNERSKPCMVCEGLCCGEIPRLNQQLANITRERDDYKADYLRMHKMFMDLKYPDTVPAHETSEWRPIETAPKDEKPILLGCPAIGAMKDPGSTRVFEGRWNSVQKTWTSMNGFLLLSVATHWRPLPTPPSSSQKAGEHRHGAAQDFVEYDPEGGVRIDMARYLRSPAGQAQLKELDGQKASDIGKGERHE